jgi:predicted ATPase
MPDGGIARTAPLGREAEQRVLRRLLDDAAAGQASALVLGGEAGQGKTALVEWVTAAAHERDFSVLSATGVEFESELAFSGLTALLRPLLDHIGELTDLQSQALQGALGLSPSDGPALTVYGATLSLLS